MSTLRLTSSFVLLYFRNQYDKHKKHETQKADLKRMFFLLTAIKRFFVCREGLKIENLKLSQYRSLRERE